MSWFADPVPYFFGGLAMAAVGLILAHIFPRW